MKRILFILLISTLTLACSNEPIDRLIEGTWKLTAVNLVTPLDINSDGIANLNVIQESPIIDATLTLRENGNGTIFYNSWVSFSTRIEDGNLFFMLASSKGSDDLPKPFTYFKNDNTVTIHHDITFNHVIGGNSILILDNKKFYMEVKNGFVVKDIDTFSESVSQDVIYEFTKQE